MPGSRPLFIHGDPQTSLALHPGFSLAALAGRGFHPVSTTKATSRCWVLHPAQRPHPLLQERLQGLPGSLSIWMSEIGLSLRATGSSYLPVHPE